MVRQQVLSSLHQNQSLHTQHNQPKYTMNTHPKLNRMRTESVSSLSSTSSHASPSRGRQIKEKLLSHSISPDENKMKRDRVPFVEMFSPVRAIRAARAGIKRKRGGGPVIVASTRGTIIQGKGKITSKQLKDIDRGSEMKDPLKPVDTKRTFRSKRRTDSRDASNTSLHHGMKALVLTDTDPNIPSSVRLITSARKVSASGSVRSTRSRLQRQQQQQQQQQDQAREESEDEMIDDADEDERLLLQAPSWQLHRLKKSKLLKLHIILGTWEEDEDVDLDLYTKQELVEGLIKARSNKITSRISTYSNDYFKAVPLASSSSFSSASLKRRPTTSTIVSQSSLYTDEEEASESESEANDAGGEETEAEPMKIGRRRQDIRLLGVSSPMAGRLRHARPKMAATTLEINQDREGMGKSSMSSSRLSSPLGRKLRPSKSMLFAASSPIRTRKGKATRKQVNNIKGRLTVPLNRSETVRDVFPRRLNNTPKQTRRKQILGTCSNKNVAFGDDQHHDSIFDDQHEWVDASPESIHRYSLNPPRRAKVKAQEQLQHLNEDDYAAQDHNDDGDFVEQEDMSIDETPTKISVKNQLKLVEDNEVIPYEDNYDENDNEWEVRSQSYETDINASPSKMRKLRNGKIRLPTTITTNLMSKIKGEEERDYDGRVEGEEEKDDVEMDEGGEGNDTLDAAMEAPSTSSLLRLKRNQLLELCGRLYIDIPADATKATMVDAVLADTKTQPPLSASTSSSKILRTNSTDSGLTIGPESSTCSTGSSGRKTNQARRGSKQIQGRARRSQQRLSEKPLLLRSHSNEIQAARPSTPIPSEALQSPINACEDELNGLDLESLNLTDKEIPFSKLEKLEKIGSGGFKDVYIGKYQISKKTTKKVAIADIRDQLSEMDIKELTLLRDLKHENIVRFIGVCVPPVDMRLVPCMIVSELCSNGDLFDYIRNVPAPPDEEIFRLMLETARGLEYLHTRTPAIIHRDCKSTNVLVTRNRTAKINDFGLARVRNSKRSMIKSLVGTVNWQAVELWSPKPNYNEKVDVWSAAMTFWETLQWHQKEKTYPFQEMNEHQIYQDVGQKRLRPSTISIRRNYGGEIVDLLDEMWNHHAKERPTMTQVCIRLEELIEIKKVASRSKQQISSKSIR